MRLARVTAAVAVAALALGVVAALSASAPRLAGTNDLRAFHPVPLPPGATVCQGPELAFGDAGRLRVIAAGTGGSGPPLAVSVRADGRVVSRGSAAAGYGDGGVAAEIERLDESLIADEVCIRNAGRAGIALRGEPLPAEQVAEVDATPAEARLRLEWVRPGSESWFELVPAVSHRFGLGKAEWLGSWTLVLAAVLVLLAAAAALRLVLGGRGGRWRSGP